MVYDYEFEHLYNEIVSENQDELEKLRILARKEYKRRKKENIATVFAIIQPLFNVIILPFLLMFLFQDSFSIMFFIVPILLVFAWIIILEKVVFKWTKTKFGLEFESAYDEKVTSKILETCNIKSVYDEDLNSIDELDGKQEKELSEEVEQNDIEEEIYLPMYGEDFFEHDADSCVGRGIAYYNYTSNGEVLIETLLAEKVSCERKDRMDVAIFDGCFSRFEMQIDTKSKIIIKKKDIEYKYAEKIQLNSYVFEKYYDVYSDDSETVKQILTEEVQEVLVKYCEEDIYELLIQGRYIYILINSGDLRGYNDAYEFSLNKEKIYKCYRTFKCIADISEKFKSIV